MLPHGTWPSPLSAADLAAGSTRPGDLVAAGEQLLWTEMRPSEDGRQALVGWDGREVSDRVPAGFDVRTRVHEYGGAPFVVAGDQVLASNHDDQRLHRLGGRHPRPVTAPGDRPGAVRWADARAMPGGRFVVAVRETHPASGTPRNEIVALDLHDASEHVLVTGRDFVAAPRPSPDGGRLAWLAWDHPSMPWDSAELWVADLRDLELGEPHRLAGDATTSVSSVVWMPDGRLAFSTDATGYWEVHVSADGHHHEQVSSFQADCGSPAWQFGNQSLAPLPDGRLACVLTERATHRMVLLDPDTSEVTAVSLPYAWLDRIQPYGRGVAFLAAEASGNRAVVVWTPGRPAIEVRRYELPVLVRDDCPVPEPIEVGTPDGVVGPLPEARDRYVARSPLHRADQLSRPMLLLQGLDDAVVPPEQAEAMAAAAAERGVPHAYIAFEDEQHGFRRAENIVTWLESELAFYGQVMGFTPAGDLPELVLHGSPVESG